MAAEVLYRVPVRATFLVALIGQRGASDSAQNVAFTYDLPPEDDH